MSRKMVILTEGHSNPHTAKTACSVIRYRRDEVLAVLDSTLAGEDCSDRLGVAPGISFIASLDEAPGANTLLIGIAPPGGQIPDAWRRIVLSAIDRGMDVVSGLHEFISEDEQFASAARQQDVQLVDVRKIDMQTIARRPGFREGCFRVHTVGHDCSVGKMVCAIEITNGLKARGHDAKFLATGQTGIMVEGDGYPLDRVIADFVSGATERLVLENEHHEILVIEGQGSLVHPSYSAVTLGILHGALPHALVLCFEVGREGVTGVEHVRIPPLPRIIEINEMMAGLCQPCPVVAVAMNGRRIGAGEAEEHRRRVEDELQLPVADIFRDGPERIIDAVEQARQDWRAGDGGE
jgi:uncharacterized NAD-dependent epimerase/dehydratase family protein